MATPPPPVPTVPTSNTILASSFYWIKPLGQDNWLAWKHRIQAVLRECKLIGHINGTISEPPRTNAGYRVWKEDDEKTQTQLELSMEDKELDNLTGDNAAEMWANLCNVKESKGKMGILRTWKILYWAIMDNSTELSVHIALSKCYRVELSALGSVIEDDDFSMLILSSLPDSWESFNEAYLGSHADTTESIKSKELIKILLDEDKHCKNQDLTNTALISQKFQKGNGSSSKASTSPQNSDKSWSICHNCGKAGHYARDCWSKGGGKEGWEGGTTAR